MKIFKISFNEVIPKDKMIRNWYVNSFYSPPDQGCWIIYSDEPMDESEILKNLTDENIDKYMNN